VGEEEAATVSPPSDDLVTADGDLPEVTSLGRQGR